MASKVLVLLAAAVALNTKSTSAAYSSEEVAQIVLAHNRGRSAVSPKAANMLELVWDADLALSAQEWADKCKYERPLGRNRAYTNIGQNLFIKKDSSASDPPSPVTAPVRSWNGQSKKYTYSDNSCSDKCAEYKQNIWANTEKVGCGIKYCEVASTSSGTTYQKAWIVACNYSPRADVIAKPYIEGNSCSQCPSGMLCRNNVCYNSPQEEAGSDSCQIECQNCGTKTSQCTCDCQNGYFGSLCEKYCEDTDVQCGAENGWPESQCGFDPNVYDKCPKMCGVCEPAPRIADC